MKREKHNFIWYFAVLFSVFLIMSGACVYAAGDVRVTPLRQVVTACSDGAIAAMQCSKYVGSLK